MEHGRGCVELGVGVGVGVVFWGLGVVLVSGRFVPLGDCVLAGVNLLVRPAGTLVFIVGGMGGDEE